VRSLTVGRIGDCKSETLHTWWRAAAVLQIVEDTPSRLALKFGSGLQSTAVTLDKTTGTARFERKTLFTRKPIEVPFAEIAAITVVPMRSLGVVTNAPLVQLKSGKRFWLADTGSRTESVEAARQMRMVLGMATAGADAAADDGIVAPHPSPGVRRTIWGLSTAAALLAIAVGGMRVANMFTLPDCDHPDTRATLNKIFEEKKVNVERLGAATTVSSTDKERVCKARADVPGGALNLDYHIDWSGWSMRVTIDKAEAEVEIDPAQLAAVKKAADEFLSLASQSHVNGRPPRLSEPTVRELLDKVFDVSDLLGTTLAAADIGKATEWFATGDRVGTVYILAGTGVNDIGRLPNDPAVQRQTHRNVAEFAPEFARYLDFQLRLVGVIMNAVLKRNADGDQAVLERPDVKRETAETRVTVAETLTGTLTTLAYDGVSDDWRRERLKLLNEISPQAAQLLLPEQARAVREHAQKVATFVKDQGVRDAITAFGEQIGGK
jgi:hypothetical protein